MPDIVLTTLNARYPHCALGLRYLMANMGELRDKTVMCEFGINQLSVDVLDAILEHNPRIVGLGVYVWNVEQTTRLVAELKRVRPQTTVVLGGPEVSYASEHPEVAQLADYVIMGEADVAFVRLCRQILEGDASSDSVIAAELPVLGELNQPYVLYSENDIANRVVYVEASRGCPFTCEFCLSALDPSVRQFPLDQFLSAMTSLLDRGVQRFKFVDRAFNLNVATATRILEFFLDRQEPGLFLHFEVVPDRLPESIRSLIREFPAGALQFEAGVQTFDPVVAERIGRRQDYDRLETNLQFLRQQTGVHIHADLIVGLPGETVASFGRGFDRLVALNPQEIQVGILKRLRGAPIARHDEDWDMVYSPNAPYQLLQNKLLDATVLGDLRRFARYWDLVANSGNFVESLPLIWGSNSPFECFQRFCAWLFECEGRTHGVPLLRLAEYVFRFLTEENGLPKQRVAECIWRDYRRGGRHDRPRFLRSFSLSHWAVQGESPAASPTRQSRHLEQPDG
jgi:radical SAM superfamily enzyme YgiQ (UPF0313 family)